MPLTKDVFQITLRGRDRLVELKFSLPSELLAELAKVLKDLTAGLDPEKEFTHIAISGPWPPHKEYEFAEISYPAEGGSGVERPLVIEPKAFQEYNNVLAETQNEAVRQIDLYLREIYKALPGENLDDVYRREVEDKGISPT